MWIAALMQIDGYGWCSRRNLGLQLAAHLLITAGCVTGWMGELLSLSLKTAFQVWLYGLGTFVSWCCKFIIWYYYNSTFTVFTISI